MKSRSILPNSDNDGHGSWGIFEFPNEPAFVVKLFCDRQQFTNEKVGYDKVLGDSYLMYFANQYCSIDIQLDTSIYPKNRQYPPFEMALKMPFLMSPPWDKLGKLATPETEIKLEEFDIDVERVKNNLQRVGIAFWEPTFFIDSRSHVIKAIDFTFDEMTRNNYVDSNSNENESLNQMLGIRETCMAHNVYSAIVKVIKENRLSEPFSSNDFENACPGFGAGTYNAFLHKHRKGNPGGSSELFELVAPGKFRCLRPYRYGF